MSALPPIADIAQRDRHVDPVRRKVRRTRTIVTTRLASGPRHGVGAFALQAPKDQGHTD
jgi:hypothetical protein